MSNIRGILENYLLFIVLFAIFLVLFMIFLLFAKKKDNKKSWRLYGYLINLRTQDIFSLSLITINGLFLIYTLAMKIKLNIPVIVVSMLMIFIAYLCCFNFKALVIGILTNSVNLAVIYMANLVNNLRIEGDTTLFYILQIMLNIFGVLFYIFTTILFIKNIHKKEKKHGQNN